ncbi:MAG: response regulator transcription factor [Candidatus Koribacter versatilis]|uniref:Response regulator transcription factor n=1 Tax=Candidatus Korobacter versatilis TaxID=658062 RepID=A0A932A8P5_9BACT|nr:response regulator transcription factor [Candidatus Koribacter versatilis]
MNEHKPRILVVDDEPQILRVLRRGLEGQGFEVATAPDAESGLDIFKASAFNLIVTDLRLPGLGGTELCGRVRQSSTVPIIVLSVKGDETTKVQAFDAGADDYVTKPFGIEELLARIRALMRRSAAAPASLQAPLEVGDFRVEPDQRRISVREREVHLTPKEYELLTFLISNHGRVLTHRAILTAVWGANSSEQSEYLRVFVGQLRKKIEKDPRNPKHLLTEPWIGYRFDPVA